MKINLNSIEFINTIISALMPVVILFLGFLFNHFENSRSEEKERHIAIQAISKGIYGRRARAELVYSSLMRDLSIEEIIDRKKLYDEEYFQWNRSIKANLLIVEDVLDAPLNEHLDYFIQIALVKNHFSPIDNCLTKAYDYRVRSSKSAADFLQQCEMKQQLKQTLSCSDAITDVLYQITTSTIETPSEHDLLKALTSSCGVYSKP